MRIRFYSASFPLFLFQYILIFSDSSSLDRPALFLFLIYVIHFRLMHIWSLNFHGSTNQLHIASFPLIGKFIHFFPTWKFFALNFHIFIVSPLCERSVYILTATAYRIFFFLEQGSQYCTLTVMPLKLSTANIVLR